jgi:hypothetical protein
LPYIQTPEHPPPPQRTKLIESIQASLPFVERLTELYRQNPGTKPSPKTGIQSSLARLRLCHSSPPSLRSSQRTAVLRSFLLSCPQSPPNPRVVPGAALVGQTAWRRLFPFSGFLLSIYFPLRFVRQSFSLSSVSFSAPGVGIPRAGGTQGSEDSSISFPSSPVTFFSCGRLADSLLFWRSFLSALPLVPDAGGGTRVSTGRKMRYVLGYAIATEVRSRPEQFGRVHPSSLL